jgi:hypothetical protein
MKMGQDFFNEDGLFFQDALLALENSAEVIFECPLTEIQSDTRRNAVFMTVKNHIALSVVVSSILLLIFRSISMAVAALITGVCIDFDHIFDYLREYGSRFNLPFFFETFEKTLYRRVVLFLHAWEWVVLLFVSAIWIPQKNVILGVAFGALAHLIADQWTNDSSPQGYFFLWRLFHGFRVRASFPRKGIEE